VMPRTDPRSRITRPAAPHRPRRHAPDPVHQVHPVPPHPSYRMRAMRTRSGISRCPFGACASFSHAVLETAVAADLQELGGEGAE
jgi:hypothetical protein